VKNDTVPVSKLEGKLPGKKPPLSPHDIDSIIHERIQDYGILDSDIHKESMIYAKKGQLREVWKVKFSTRSPKGSWILFLDRYTGAIIEERNVLWKARGKGKAFIPNPVVSLDRDDLYDAKDQDQEGFSDYLAGSVFDRYKKVPRKAKLAEWDAKGYPGGAECLRRLDSSKHYPEDMEGEEHADGEIWSACLWKVRKLLGRKKADTVILESLFYLNQYADFRDGAEAILMAEKNLYGGRRTKGLTRIFSERGILSVYK